MFSGRIVSAFTGLFFTVMASRVLGTSGFGVVEVIVSFVTFASYPIGSIAYWATRDIARGRMVGRTALASGAVLSGLGLVIYFGFSLFSYSRIGASVVPFLLGALLIPLSYWNAVASAIVTGYRPSVYGTSLVFSELAKVVVAYEGLYVYHLGINAVVVALMAAYLAQSVISTYMVRNTTTQGFDASEVRRWLKLAWLPALSYLPASLAVADTTAVALLHGTSVVGVYQAAFTVASIVSYATALIFTMYPLLLKGGDVRLPAVSLELSLLLAIPKAVGCIVLAGPILYVYGPSFVEGAAGLSILAVMFIFNNFSLLVDQTLMGTETVDSGQTPSFRKLAGSNLIFVSLANIGYGIAYLVILFLAVNFAASMGFSDSADVATWATVQLVVTLAFALFKARRARLHAKLMPGISIVYYLAGAAVMAMAVYLFSGVVVTRDVGTLVYGLRLLVVIAFGAAVYFGSVYAMDSKFRDLTRSFLRRL